MKRLAIGFFFAIIGYVLAAFAGYWLIDWFSANVHDRSLEAVMTSLFVSGPIGAVIGIVAGFIVAARTSDRQNTGADS